MKTVLFGITFASIQYVWLIIPLVCLIGVVVYRLLKTKRVAFALVGNHLGLLKNYSYIRHVVRTCLFIIAFLSLFITLLRPQWNEKEQAVQHQGREVLIALDISKSMCAADCSVNRLHAAKEKIKLLIQSLNSERVGLILFSGMAFLHCPFTADFYAFESFLDIVSVESFSTGTTAFDAALAEALRVFERTPSKKTRLCILFTDGEDFSSQLDRIKKQARQEDMHIVAVGVGTTYGAPIPDLDTNGVQRGHITDENGTIVISRLNEQSLSLLVSDIGGCYVKMAEDQSDIEKIKEYIMSFETEVFEDKMVTQKEDQYPWFAVVSFLALLIEWFL